MSCEGRRRAIRDVALGDPVPAVLRTHLAECVSCRATLARDRALLGSIEEELGGMLSAVPSEGFVAAARARVDEAKKDSSDRALRRWVPVVAAASVLVAVVLLPGRSLRTPWKATSPNEAPTAHGPRAVVPEHEAPAPGPPMPALAEVQTVVSEREAPQRSEDITLPTHGVRWAPTADPAPRVAPEVLIASRDVEAVHRFVAGRTGWRLVGEEPGVWESSSLAGSSGEGWEIEEGEGPVAHEWELDDWPLAPGD